MSTLKQDILSVKDNLARLKGSYRKQSIYWRDEYIKVCDENEELKNRLASVRKELDEYKPKVKVKITTHKNYFN